MGDEFAYLCTTGSTRTGIVATCDVTETTLSRSRLSGCHKGDVLPHVVPQLCVISRFYDQSQITAREAINASSTHACQYEP